MYKLNMLFLPSGRYAEAHDNICRAYEIEPRHPLIPLMRAEYYFHTMSFRKALRAYIIFYKYIKRHQEIPPPTYDYLSDLSHCYLFLRKQKKAKMFANEAEKYNVKHEDNEVLKEIDRTASYGSFDFKFTIEPYTYGYLNYETTTKDVRFRARLYLAAMQSLMKNNIKPLTKEIARIKKNTNNDLPAGLLDSVSGRVKFILGRKDDGLTEMRQAMNLNDSVITISNMLQCMASHDANDNETDRLTRRLLSMLHDKKFTDFDHIYFLTCKITQKHAGDWFKFYISMSEILSELHEYHFNLGRCCYFAEEYDTALNHYKNARAEVDKNPFFISLEESRCYRKMGEEEKSDQLFAQALIENPELNQDKAISLGQE